jgi:hypothetical protein
MSISCSGGSAKENKVNTNAPTLSIESTEKKGRDI